MSEKKSLSNMAQNIINKTISGAEIYPSGVARCFGNIEAIIDRGFTDKIPAEAVIAEIEDKINEIRNILSKEPHNDHR